jgi:hypothetical protein
MTERRNCITLPPMRTPPQLLPHGKGDHPTGHELSRQAHEHSNNAYKHSEEHSKKPSSFPTDKDCGYTLK